MEHRFLNLPIKNGAPKRKVTTLVDGRVEGVNEIELADASPDWWAFIDVSAWHGKTITVQVEKLPEGSGALGMIESGDSIKEAQDIFHEKLRPQIHFSSRRGWLNDPNGLVFYRGEFHLFYQHNPFGWDWGNMHWGHATSRDLVHWEEHADALLPDASGLMFSGSAVVDRKNTSGLGQDGQPPIVLLYTGWGKDIGGSEFQSLAWSNDGRTFKKFGGNPVVPQITKENRDPKIFWYEPTQRWIMVLYVEEPADAEVFRAGGRDPYRHIVQFLTSPNLKDWTLSSRFDGGTGSDRFLYECPDLFELPVENEGIRKWVLTAANGEYIVGDFDGVRFKPVGDKLPGVHGEAFYAAQSFSDAPDGRRIQIGWGRVPSPGMPFNQLQLLPCELSLVKTSEGVRLARKPVKELESLRKSPNMSKSLEEFRADLIEILTEFEPGENGAFEFHVRGAKIVYDAARHELSIEGVTAKAPLIEGKQRLHIFVDRTAIEVFASDGLVYAPIAFIPEPNERSVGIVANNTSAKMLSLEVYELGSIWDSSGR